MKFPWGDIEKDKTALLRVPRGFKKQIVCMFKNNLGHAIIILLSVSDKTAVVCLIVKNDYFGE